jgi:hypothetical protein
VNDSNGHKTDPDDSLIVQANYEAQTEKAFDDWLDKVMQFLLPKLIYDRSKHSCYEKFVQNWMRKHGISLAFEGERCAVLRDGKVFATWEPKRHE